MIMADLEARGRSTGGPPPSFAFLGGGGGSVENGGGDEAGKTAELGDGPHRDPYLLSFFQPDPIINPKHTPECP